MQNYTQNMCLNVSMDNFYWQENHTLSKELVVTKRMEKDSMEDAQDSVRRARQEAREERVVTAHLREDCSRLQVPQHNTFFTCIRV